MRLRFRGSCWDEAPTPVMPPPIPTSAYRFCGQEDPSHVHAQQSFRDLARSEGLEAPCPYRLLRRPQPAGYLSSWSCTVAMKQCWTAHDRGQPGSEERGDGENLSRDNAGKRARCTPSLPQNEEFFRHRQHPAVQPLPTSLGCCIIASDPTTALAPELSFPKVMLADRSRRASLFSLTQTMLGAIPELSSLSRRSKESVLHSNTGDIGAGRSLVELFRRSSPTLPAGGVATEASSIFQEQQEEQRQEQQRFQEISLDLDDEAFAVLRGILPRDDAAKLSLGNDATDDWAPSAVPRSTWGALELDRMLKPWPMNLRQGTPSPSWRTPGEEPRPIRVELHHSGGRLRLLDKDEPAMRDGGGLAREGENGVSPVLPGGDVHATNGLPQVFERSVGCFTRISVDGFGGEDELPEHDRGTVLKRHNVGLLGLLGSMRQEKQLDAADKARCSPLACIHPHRGFDPNSPAVGSCLFPGRFPPIPITTVETPTGARSFQTQRNQGGLGEGWFSASSQGSSRLAAGIDGIGGGGTVQGGRDLLAPLWTALVKVGITGPRLSSPPSLLWALAPRRPLAGQRGQRCALFTHVLKTRSSGTTMWSPKSVAARTDALLEGILASWRKMHAPPAHIAPRSRQRARSKLVPTPTPPAPPLAPPTPAAGAAAAPAAAQQVPPAKVPFPTKPDAVIPGHGTQAVSAEAVSASATGARGDPLRGTPAYEGTGGVLGDSRSQHQRERVERSARLSHARASLGFELEGRRGGSRQSEGLLQPHEGGAAVARPMHAETVGAGTPAASGSSSSGKAPSRGKRKLDGVNWTFGAGGSSAGKGVRGRVLSSPAPRTITSRNGSSSGTRSLEPKKPGVGGDARPSPPLTTEGSGCRLQEEMSSASSHEGRFCETASSAGQFQEVALSRAVLAAAPHDCRPRAVGRPGGTASSPSGSRADGAGTAKRRHTLAGLFDEDGVAAADAAGHLSAPSVPRNKSVLARSASPSKPSGLAVVRREETAPSSPQVTCRFPVGSSPSAPTPEGDASEATDARHSQPQPSSMGVTVAAARSPSRMPASPSRHEDRATSAGPAATRDVHVSRPTSTISEGVRQQRTVAGRKRSQDRSRLESEGAYEAGRGEDTAMAGCESSRQREILAAIRSGSLGHTYLLPRGQTRRLTADSAGDSATPGTKTARRASEPSAGGAYMDVGKGMRESVRGASLASAPGGGASADQPTVVSAHQVGRPAAASLHWPLYATVSEDFLLKAESTVLALSAPTQPPPPQALPPATASTQSAKAMALKMDLMYYSRGMTAKEAAGVAGVCGGGVARGGEAGAGAAATGTAPHPTRGGRFHLLELPVGRPVDLFVGSRSAVVIFDNRDGDGGGGGGAKGKGGSYNTTEAAAAAAEDDSGAEREAELAEAKENLRLLQLQTLKFSTLVVIFQMDKARVGGAESRKGVGLRLRPGLAKLEQWLVGCPCRVLIRYSYSDTQLAELITHAAIAAQRGGSSTASAGGGAAPVAVGVSAAPSDGKRRRLGAVNAFPASPRGETRAVFTCRGGAGARSPLEAIEERSRRDPGWATWHYRQAWFLQLFPTLNAFSASALLSLASLKHLIVAPYEELAPGLLGRGAGGSGGGGDGGGGKGGVSAESLRDFCATVRLGVDEVSLRRRHAS